MKEKYKKLKNQGLCITCGCRPINYSRSKSSCTVCLDKVLKWSKARYQEKKEDILAYQQEYRQLHKDEIAAYRKEYYQKNRKVILEKQKDYRETHKDEVAKAKKKCRERRIEQYLKREKEWKRNNRERRMLLSYISTKKRRAIKYGLSEHYTHQEWKNTLIYWNFRCVNCGATENIEPDHIIPLSVGGNDTIDNIQPLCLTCNRKKHVKIIDYRWQCT